MGIIYGPVGLICAGFSPVGLFLGRNVKEFQFYIRMPNFRLLGSIIKKKYPKVVDPLKGTYPILWKLFYSWTDSNRIRTVYVK